MGRLRSIPTSSEAIERQYELRPVDCRRRGSKGSSHLSVSIKIKYRSELPSPAERGYVRTEPSPFGRRTRDRDEEGLAVSAMEISCISATRWGTRPAPYGRRFGQA